MTDVNSCLGKKMRELRGDKSLYQVGEELGFSRSLLRRYETGERTPEDETLRKLAHYYGVHFQLLKFAHFDDQYPVESDSRHHILEWAKLQL